MWAPVSIPGTLSFSFCNAHVTSSVNLRNQYCQLEEEFGNQAVLETFWGRGNRGGAQGKEFDL